MEKETLTKTKVDCCPSHIAKVICQVCGIIILQKNYERHLATKHISENSKDLKPKNVLNISQWLTSSSSKRKHVGETVVRVGLTDLGKRSSHTKTVDNTP